MSIIIGAYSFDGPYTNTDLLVDKSGIYAILCTSPDDKYTVVDIGESATVKSCVDTHDRKDCWTHNCNETLTVAVFYTPSKQQAGRIEIEQELRNQYNPPCGKQ